MKDGMKVYRYDNGFVHCKTMVIDNEVGSVGCGSMDLGRLEVKFEMNGLVYNEKVAGELSEGLDKEIKKSREVREEG
nr:hypothetical protein [Staphylococcus auricularis]